jgi:molybdenum cofactor cytidylyltransferase
MRTLAMTSANVEAGIVCHDVRNPQQRNEVFVRKGASLGADEVRALLERGVTELHIAVPDADDVGEDEAARRLAEALAGPGVGLGEAHFGQVSFRAASRGMLRVERAAIDRVNAFDGVLLLTAEADRPVDSGMTLGVVKCAPLFLPESTLAAIESLHFSALHVAAFQSLRVGLVAPRERLRGGAFERSQTALADALGWYGSTLESVIGAEATIDSMKSAYRELAHLDLVLAAGAAGTDPLDVVFEGLRKAGGSVDQIGIPAEPGTACWIGHIGSTPVLGLASCELFGQPGALDLLLPALHTGAALDKALLSALAPGGLLLGPARIAPYHTRAGRDS